MMNLESDNTFLSVGKSVLDEQPKKVKILCKQQDFKRSMTASLQSLAIFNPCQYAIACNYFEVL